MIIATIVLCFMTDVSGKWWVEEKIHMQAEGEELSRDAIATRVHELGLIRTNIKYLQHTFCTEWEWA